GELVHLVLQGLQMPRARPPRDGDERGEAQDDEREQEPRRPFRGESPRRRRSKGHVLSIRSVKACSARGCASTAQHPLSCCTQMHSRTFDQSTTVHPKRATQCTPPV